MSVIFTQVKNKKRWSQVMYMSYVLDFKEKTMDGKDIINGYSIGCIFFLFDA